MTKNAEKNIASLKTLLSFFSSSLFLSIKKVEETFFSFIKSIGKPKKRKKEKKKREKSKELWR